MRFLPLDDTFDKSITLSLIGAINSRLALHDLNNYQSFSDINSNISDINTKLNYIDTGLSIVNSKIADSNSNIANLNLNVNDLYAKHKTTNIVLAWQSEQQAEILRGMGQSGLYLLRQQTFNAKEPEDRRFIGPYSVESQHNHSDFFNVVGTAELSAVINGYYIRTRHNDYKLVKPAPVNSGFLSTIEIPPPSVPNSISSLQNPDDQIEAMRQLFQSYANGGWPEGFAFNLSYLEVWFEPFTLSNSETFYSDRHQIATKTAQQDLEQILKYNTTGFKNIRENLLFNAPTVKFVNSDGTVDLVRIKYRIAAIDLSSLGDIRDKIELVQDYLLENYNPTSNYFKRYRLSENKNQPGFLDQIMSMIPGLDGEGANLNEVYKDISLNTDVTILDYNNNPLNIGYYNRYAGIPTNDASGFSKFLRSFNDPYLFVAMNTQNSVYGPKIDNRNYKVSYAIPLEIILRTCLENWNPYNLPSLQPGTTLTGNGTQNSPYNAYSTRQNFYLTPSSFYSGQNESLPANTAKVSVWIYDSNGVARNVIASGIYVDLPPINGVGTIRIRHAIFPVYHEGGYAFAYNSRVNKLQSENIVRLTQGNVLTTGTNMNNSMSIDNLKIRTTNLENRANNTDYYLDSFNSKLSNIENTTINITTLLTNAFTSLSGIFNNLNSFLLTLED